MRIESTFTVQAPPAEVYDALVDLERVGPCIPGASVGPAGADGEHPAQIAVRVGPMRMTYRGTVRLLERDAAARRAVLLADVRESRGQGSARAEMTMQVGEADAGASVASTTAVRLTGKAAQMGRGMIDDITQRLVADMAGRLSAMLAERPAAAAPAEPAPAPPVNGLRLALRALRDRLVRLLRRRA